MSKQRFDRFGMFGIDERTAMSRKRPVRNKNYKRVRPDGRQVNGTTGRINIFGANVAKSKGFPTKV